MSDGVKRNVGQAETNQIIAADYLQGNGQTGFVRLDQSDVPGGSNEYDAANDDNEIACVLAVGGAATFDAGCTAKRGDAPADDDELAQGDLLKAPLTKVVIKTGVAYVFPKEKLADN